MLLYNTQSRKKEEFIPRLKNKVLLYVCGVTPYDTTHLGHAFTYVSYDALVRYLTYKGLEVTYVQNVTDIDDDILKRAKRDKRDWQELGEYWTKRFLSDLETLNISMPTHYVKATESIGKMIEMIEALLQKGYAYENQGNIYYSIHSFSEYGKLSHFSQKQMLHIFKERGGNPADPLKNDKLDFLLWQKSAADEPFWESPWGKGRPGWHIECSAMVSEYLGDSIDIHGGGKDLIYPHHESEIAQSEGYSGEEPFVKIWMHTGMLMYQGEKMAKSLGNLVMATELLKTYSPNAIRWLLLSHHYRSPWEYYDYEMEEAQEFTDRVCKAVKTSSGSEEKLDAEILSHFDQYMEDDLNTPKALDLIHEVSDRVLKEGDESLHPTLTKLLKILGFILIEK